MTKKLMGSRFPNSSSTNRIYTKIQMQDGEFTIEDEKLVFRAKILYFLRVKRLDLIIPLKEIKKIETMTLNGFMPFGVCIYLKDGTEHMLGHVNNRKLQEFIVDAMKECGIDVNSNRTEDMEEAIKDIEAIEKKKNGRQIIKIIIFSILIMIIIVSYQVIKDFKEEDILSEEIDKINNMNIFTQEIDMEIKTKGDYAKVEEAIKKFDSEIIEQKKIYYYNSAYGIFNEITIDYLRENKGKFQEKLEALENNEKIFKETYNNIINMLDEEYIMKYIEEYNLDSYYVDYYRDIMLNQEENDEILKTWEEDFKTNEEKMTYLKELIQILIDYDDVWSIEGNSFYIDDSDALIRYNELYNKINK